ncbi:MAG: hypothetical protein LBU89_07150 [Fibromonadaceae bacterium]|jgi:flagellar basal-body rod modification protein FlgD|nr:hypothetical protein [Fibromonadaceae bacterium]
MSVESTGGLFSYTNEQQVRRVSLTGEGSSVVSQGDTKLFEKAGETMGKDQFLNLLVAQLKYQDPLNPAEDTQFVAQLAQFSQLEFTQNSTAAISSLASNMQAFMELQSLQAQSITNASATPLLGKDVRVMENSFNYPGVGEKELNIFLMEGHKSGTVVIKDKDGKIVAELEADVDTIKGGEVKVKWDGKDQETGNPFLGGKFTVEVLDATGLKAAGYAYQDGKVSGVSFNSGGASLTINDVQYGLGLIVHVKDIEDMKDGNKDKDESKEA